MAPGIIGMGIISLVGLVLLALSLLDRKPE